MEMLHKRSRLRICDSMLWSSKSRANLSQFEWVLPRERYEHNCYSIPKQQVFFAIKKAINFNFSKISFPVSLATIISFGPFRYFLLVLQSVQIWRHLVDIKCFQEISSPNPFITDSLTFEDINSPWRYSVRNNRNWLYFPLIEIFRFEDEN